MSSDLFGEFSNEGVCILDDGLDITYWESFLPADDASNFLEALQVEIDWQQPSIWMFGRKVKVPRLTAWYGNENAGYRYSGIQNNPIGWTPTLLRLRRLVESTTRSQYNSVLLNLYRNGSDHLSWHSDDEPELGAEPTIASLSLGTPRIFCLRSKSRLASQSKRDLLLPSGSLLCMRGSTQRMWEHSIKKDLKISAPRINLTFRTVEISQKARTD